MTEVVSFDAEGFTPYAEASVEVFGVAMDAPVTELQSRQAIVLRHLGRPGFTAVAALEAERLVGFGYAYPGRRGQWWHDIVSTALGPEAAAQWLSSSFEIVELHVRPEAQGSGLGRQLLTALLAGAPGGTAVLSTGDRDSRARRLYRSMGFVDLLTAFRFPGREEPYCVMGRPLPVPVG